MESNARKLPPRTYELRDDPFKKFGMYAFCAAAVALGWYSDDLLVQLSGAFFGLCALVMMFASSLLVRATPQGLWIGGLGRPKHISWPEIAEITVGEFTVRGNTQRLLWIKPTEASRHFWRVPRLTRLWSKFIGFPAGGLLVSTTGTDPQEVVDALHELYAEYVREGILPGTDTKR